MCDLLAELDHSSSVSIHPATRDDLFDYTKFPGCWYKHLVGDIKINHMFKFTGADGHVGNRFEASIPPEQLESVQICPTRYDKEKIC